MQRLVISYQLRQKRATEHRYVSSNRVHSGVEDGAVAAQLPARHILLLVFTGNFIGIVCARTLHYQFYSW
jgi:alpha-1,3-mannosyltransferase